MQYLNLAYTPGFPPVYNFPMTTDFGVDIDVTLSTWTFEAFDAFGKSVYLNTAPIAATGRVVTFTIPNVTPPAPQIFIEGNYAYRVVGTNSTSHISTIAYKGFLTVEPAVILT
jgi:hypothetical protein